MSRSSRIPSDIIDEPTQRIYLAALLIFIQARKLLDFLKFISISPDSITSPLLLNELINWLLIKWIIIDILYISLVKWLKIDRLEFDRNRYFILISSFVLFNYSLFGDWKFTSLLFFIPTSLSSIFVRSLSVGEYSVRLASVLGSESDFLSGRVDVHLLSPSTAHLNPSSNNYCIPFSTSSNSEPILIPLFLNNTIPSKITYNLTRLTPPYITKSYSLPASALKNHKSLTSSSSSSSSSTNDSKILVRHSSSTSSHHSTSSSNLEIYYLPINQPGIIHLNEVIDLENRSIKIKRSRASTSSVSSATTPNKWEGVRIATCPRAGFLHGEGEDTGIINKYLTKSHLDQSIDLNLKVAGEEPLSLSWHFLNLNTGRRSKEVILNGIRSAEREDGKEDGFIKVPFNISLSEVGRFKYFIDSITDNYNNKIEFDHDDPSISSTFESPSSSKKKIFSSTTTISKSNYSDSKEVVIHSPPQVSFVGSCGRSESVKLLKRSGEKAALEIRLGGSEGQEWNTRVRFTPEESNNGVKESRMIELSSRKELLKFEVEEAGLYELMEVNGEFCKGIVLSPSECTVSSPQIPTLQSTGFTPILDSCKSEIGTTIDLTLTGSPPFTIYYSQQSSSSSSHHNSNRPIIKSLKILNTRHSFEIKPDPGFEWEYKILAIEDSNYPRIDLIESESGSRYEFKQNVPMIGGAEFKNSNERIRKVFTCQGEMVDVDVVLKGQPPYELEYAISSPTSFTASSQLLSNLLSTSQTLHISILEAIPHSSKGGEFTISLRSLKHGNGCKRLLKGEDLIIQVKRNRPSATVLGGSENLVIIEGEDVSIPLRLTGEAPWSIEYESHVISSSKRTKERHVIRTNQPNFELELSHPLPGSYRLISIKDSHCPGDILDSSEWKIDHIPRPTLRLRDNIREGGKNARKGVCLGAVDKVGISFTGKSPFTASYSISKGKHLSKDTTKTLQSIQPESELILETDSPGRHIYTINGVSDSLYTSLSDRGLLEPSGENKIQFEQEVYPIPVASFRRSKKPRPPYCTNDKLASRSEDLVVNLDGQAPFELEFEVSRDELSERFIIPNIQSKSFEVNLSFTFTTDSPHSISIRRILDANGCERILDPTTSSDTSILLKVAKTATIVPILNQIDHCVGDFLEFNLQGGSPPFTVTYEFNSKRHVVPLSTTTFTRLATTPGRFEIISVGHGEDQCKSFEKLGLIKEVHPIPSVQVDDGNLVVVDLREGEQTEIIFSFVGTPPFTFTYSRQYPQDRSNDKTILETQTISGVMDHSYSIFSSQEGTWTVSAIEDKYCAYPLRKTSSLKLLTS